MGDNAAWQLGDGTTGPERGIEHGPEDCSPGFPEPCSIVPLAVSGLGEAVSVAAGDGHALALLRDGTVMAWGGNGDGALGAGEVITSKEVSGPETCEGFLDGRYYFPCSMTPLAVSGLSDVTAVAAGDGFSLALLKNGTVEAWGRNEAGVLGNLTTRMSTVPTVISGLSEVTQIAAGSDYALALLKNGTVMGGGIMEMGSRRRQHHRPESVRNM